jgi:hypothetical protein
MIIIYSLENTNDFLLKENFNGHINTVIPMCHFILSNCQLNIFWHYLDYQKKINQ